LGTVEIRNVKKSYGSVKVIHGLSLSIAAGEFVALVGPSGCGKSTLLRMIAGLEDISAGEIAIRDRVVNNVAPRNRDIAMVFQNYALYPHMSVRRNMGFSLRLRGVPKSEIEMRVNSAADILGLQALLDRKPRALSGGQRQRVAMGRAIVRNPTVFLFDEPLSNLDAKLRVQMRSELKELHQRLKTTTVYVTHDQIEAMTLADRIVVMNEGNIEQAGKPLDVFDKPESVFVATFIGSPAMNLLGGTVAADGRSATLADGTTVALPQLHGAKPGTKVTLGIRPEHVELGTDGWPATASVIEPTGTETQIGLRFAGQSMRVLLRGRTACQPGEAVRLVIDPARVHVFDGETGRRIRGGSTIA
jgi:multiple sugar transport system ATP-binding protein